MISIALERLAAVCNPLAMPPWDGCRGVPQEVFKEEIERAFRGGGVEEVPHNEMVPKTRAYQAMVQGGIGWHARRVAWLLHNGWTDAVDLDVGVPGLCEPSWLIQDGNHRVAAALFRGDERVVAEIAGSMSRMIELFGVADAGSASVDSARRRVWVHAEDGSMVGRFCKRAGMEINATATQQLQGLGQRLHERAGPVEREDWELFCDLVLQHHGICVDRGLLDFAPLASVASRRLRP